MDAVCRAGMAGILLNEISFYLGMVAAASTLPILLFTLIGGIAADRFRKRNLLIATQALSIVPALMLGIFTDTGVITVYQVIFFAFFLGTVNAFDMPARQSFLVEMVGKGHLLNAIALNSAAFNGARLIGPVFAGLAIAYMGLPSCFYLNAASFITCDNRPLNDKCKRRDKNISGKFLRDLAEGFYFIKNQKDIFYMIILIAVFSLFGIPFISFPACICRGDIQCRANRPGLSCKRHRLRRSFSSPHARIQK